MRLGMIARKNFSYLRRKLLLSAAMPFIQNKTHSSSHSGFTILELLLYVGISSTVLLAVSLFLSTTLSSRVKNAAVSEVEGQGAFVVNVITQSVRNATGITAPNLGASGPSLSMATASGSTSPTVFSVSSGSILMTEGVGTAIPITNSHVTVSNFVVTNLSRSGTPGNVRITFTLTFNNPSGRSEYDVVRTFTVSASRKQP